MGVGCAPCASTPCVACQTPTMRCTASAPYASARGLATCCHVTTARHTKHRHSATASASGTLRTCCAADKLRHLANMCAAAADCSSPVQTSEPLRQPLRRRYSRVSEAVLVHSRVSHLALLLSPEFPPARQFPLRRRLALLHAVVSEAVLVLSRVSQAALRRPPELPIVLQLSLH